jgi:hypothetical protein
MVDRVRAVWALSCALAVQLGCASKLDFDKVSAGHHSKDASSIAADASDPDDTTTGDAAVLDASAPASTTPNDAAPLEASSPDARDGSADAGSQDASRELDRTTFSCKAVSPEPLFCDDFESLALLDHWTDVLVEPTEPTLGGTIEIDSNAARAGHDSLLVQVHEGVAYCENCVGILAGLALPDWQAPTKLSVEFDLRVEQIDPTASRRIVLFQLVWGTWEAGFTQHTLQLESRGGSFRAGLVEFDTNGEFQASEEPPTPPFDHDFAPTGALSQWMHVTYTVHAKSATSTSNVAKLTVDDVVLFDASPRFALRAENLRLEIGVPWVDTSYFAEQDLSKRWQVRYDNVLVRSESR